MAETDISEQVGFIMATGKRIRDHMQRVQTEVIAADPELSEFAEMTMQQTSVAMMTMDRGAVGVTEMADLLGVSVPSASAMIDRLVEKGILSREHSQEDRRKVLITTAKAAGPHLEVIQQRMQEALQDIADKIGMDTTQKWFEVMLRVRSVLEEEERNQLHA
jgi:DNA-binding MarR family transcriptional regulator